MIQRIFLQVLNRSFPAGVVILAVLLARLLLKRFPKIFSYALWGVVLFRLICPVTFSSAFSLLGALKLPAVEKRQEEAVVWNEQDTGLQKQTAEQVLLTEPDNRENPKKDSLILIGTVVWLFGILGLLSYHLVSFVKLKKELRKAVWEGKNIYLVKELKTPFVMGILKPKIYLPEVLGEEEREYILLHEQIHIKRGDPFIRFISFLVLCIYWFHPAVWAAFFLSEKDMEMSCDEAVIKRMGSGVKRKYSTSLLSLSAGKYQVNGAPLAFGEGSTKNRIKNVLRYQKPAFWISFLALACVCIITLALAANPEKKTADQSYYGVVSADLEGNRVLWYVMIPKLGVMELPEAKEVSSEFQAEGFQLKAGDLVELKFSNQKQNKLLASDPPSFTKEAEAIQAVARGFSLQESGEENYLFSFPKKFLKGRLEAEKKDTILIYKLKNGRELLSETEVSKTDHNSIFVELSAKEAEVILSEYRAGIEFLLEKNGNSLESRESGEEAENAKKEESAESLRKSLQNGTVSVNVRSIARSAKCIDRYIFDSFDVPEDLKNLELAFAEDCIYWVNYERNTVNYTEVSFDTFAGLMNDWDETQNKPCILRFENNLIKEIRLLSAYGKNGISVSWGKSLNTDLLESIKREGPETYGTLVRTETAYLSGLPGEETIEVYTDGEKGLVLILDSKGNLLDAEAYDTSRSGWGSIYLGKIEGVSFLMNLHIEDREVYGGYDYQVFCFDKEGKIKQMAGSEFSFGEGYIYDDALFQKWAGEMNVYLQNSYLLLSSQDGFIRTDKVCEAGLYRYSDLKREDGI